MVDPFAFQEVEVPPMQKLPWFVVAACRLPLEVVPLDRAQALVLASEVPWRGPLEQRICVGSVVSRSEMAAAVSG